jgi:hypothetical protein
VSAAVRYAVPRADNKMRPTKAHWPHPTVFGAACSPTPLLEQSVAPQDVPVEDRCTRSACGKRWREWAAEHEVSDG